MPPAGNRRWATQSGPMLVIDGEINTQFDNGSDSMKWRSGVCAKTSHDVVFVVSRAPVNFHSFARLFRDEIGCRDALFLDGTISQAYTPDDGYVGAPAFMTSPTRHAIAVFPSASDSGPRSAQHAFADRLVEIRKTSRSATDTHSSTLWIVAFTGPSSITSAPMGAMKRPSEVPPPVLCSGSIPHRSRHTPTTTSRRRPPGVARNGCPERCQSIAEIDTVCAQDRFGALPQ